MIHRLKLRTGEGVSIHDVTGRVEELLSKSEKQEGVLTVYTRHTTTGLTINEQEAGFLDDARRTLQRLAPKKNIYAHDDLKRRDCPPNEPRNGHAHCQALCLNTSENIPFENGMLLTGRWQSLLFIDLDGPREREIIVHIGGD